MIVDKQLTDQLINVHCYMVTPFKESNLMEVDLVAFSQNLEFLIAKGVKVVAIGGGTGEIEALKTEELKMLTKRAMDVAKGRILVIPSIPGNLSEAFGLLKFYESLNVKIVMVVPPQLRWKVPGKLDGTLEYYKQLAAFSNIPLMPYNIQSWPSEFFEKLSEIKSIVCVKDPCSNPHEFYKAIQALGDRFVWIGNKKHNPGIVHLRYQMGMQSFTSGQCNFWPEPELEIHRLSLKKDWPGIIDIQHQISPLENLRLMNDDAAMVKTAMDIIGLNGGSVRPPRLNLNADEKSLLDQTMTKLKVQV